MCMSLSCMKYFYRVWGRTLIPGCPGSRRSVSNLVSYQKKTIGWSKDHRLVSHFYQLTLLPLESLLSAYCSFCAMHQNLVCILKVATITCTEWKLWMQSVTQVRVQIWCKDILFMQLYALFFSASHHITESVILTFIRVILSNSLKLLWRNSNSNIFSSVKSIKCFFNVFLISLSEFTKSCFVQWLNFPMKSIEISSFLTFTFCFFLSWPQVFLCRR